MPDETNPKAKTTNTVLGLSENIEGFLAYLFGAVSGIILFLIEKDNKFVRFHAMQSIITFIALVLIAMIPVIGWIISFFSWILWLILLVMAAQGKMFKLPLIGDLAEKYSQ